MRNPSGKRKRGQIIQPLSANLHDATVDAGTDFTQRRSLGNAQRPSLFARPGDTAVIKNTAGYDLDGAGRVLQISDKLVTDLSPDDLWLGGIEPVVPSTKQIGISLQPVPDDATDDFKISGHTFAKVTINDAQHEFADVKNGSVTLESGWHGYPIVYKPSGTGEKDCVVDLSHYSEGPIKAVVSEVGGIDAGDTGEVTIWRSGAETTTPCTEQAKYGWTASGNAAEFAKCRITWQRDEGYWEITWIEC